VNEKIEVAIGFITMGLSKFIVDLLRSLLLKFKEEKNTKRGYVLLGVLIALTIILILIYLGVGYMLIIKTKVNL